VRALVRCGGRQPGRWSSLRRRPAGAAAHVEVRGPVHGEDALSGAGCILLARIADRGRELCEPVGFVHVRGCVDWKLLVAPYPGVGLLLLFELVGFLDRGAELVTIIAAHAGASSPSRS